jgi:PilZ domain-containing protein
VGRIRQHESAYDNVSAFSGRQQSRNLQPEARDERRLSQRDRVDADGVIWLKGRSRIRCVVRDFSRFGAGLALDEAVILPAAFDLTFDRVTRRYVVVWRRNNRIGVKLKESRVATLSEATRKNELDRLTGPVPRDPGL